MYPSSLRAGKTQSSPMRPIRLDPRTTIGKLSKSADNFDSRSIRSAPSVFPSAPAHVTPQSLTEHLRPLSITKPTLMPQSLQMQPRSSTRPRQTSIAINFCHKSSQKFDSESTGSHSSETIHAHNHHMSIPRPYLTDLLWFRYWLTCHFANYLSDTFLDFLFGDVPSHEIDSLLEFLSYFEETEVYKVFDAYYEDFRQEIIEL